jgi:hypothetical protein
MGWPSHLNSMTPPAYPWEGAPSRDFSQAPKACQPESLVFTGDFRCGERPCGPGYLSRSFRLLPVSGWSLDDLLAAETQSQWQGTPHAGPEKRRRRVHPVCEPDDACSRLISGRVHPARHSLRMPFRKTPGPMELFAPGNPADTNATRCLPGMAGSLVMITQRPSIRLNSRAPSP